MTVAKCIPFGGEIDDRSMLGGKAAGLIRLLELGLDVPDGFVVVGAVPGELPDDLSVHVDALGSGPLAVRSSALDEDGAEHSFAGQFVSVLEVRGPEAVATAIDECLASASSERVVSYREATTETDSPSGDSPMSVVVQRQIEPVAAGVVFSVDTSSGRRDRVVVDAVAGLGEELMAGTAVPDHHVCTPTGEVVESTLAGLEPVLSTDALRTVVTTARDLASRLGAPVDAEWAIDDEGRCWWVQARPVTAVPADPCEFDDPIPADHVVTRANVGEMMPGPVCPLTRDVTAWGIEVAMQDIQAQVGVVKGRDPNRHLVPSRLGHLFLDLTEMAVMSSQSIGGDTEVLARAITGGVVPELTAAPPPPLLTRVPRIIRYVAEITSTKRHLTKIARLADGLAVPSGPDAAASWRVIDVNRRAIVEAYDHHLGASSAAGALSPVILQVLAAGGEPTADHHQRLARLLAGAEAESAGVAAAIDRLGDRLAGHPEAPDLLDLSPGEFAAWLTGPDTRGLDFEWKRFIDTHGHRSVRELDLRQPEWRHDPEPVLASVLARARSRSATDAASTGMADDDQSDPLEGITGFERRVLSALGRAARRAVAGREAAKSHLVAVTVAHKVAYRTLGAQLVEEGRLTDPDLVFFLTHDELGELAHGRAPRDTGAVADRRRRSLAWQESLSFPEVCVGPPEPIVATAPAENDGVIRGIPANPGRVIGPARIVSSIGDASRLEAGDIMVAPVTDVGWTPWFGVVSGVVTDVGSSVSHGAVVAREYGLPAVVNTLDATRRLTDGDIVEVDGAAGTVRRV